MSSKYGYFDNNGSWCERNIVCTTQWLRENKLYTSTDQFHRREHPDYKYRSFKVIFISGYWHVIVFTKMHNFIKGQWTNYIMKWVDFKRYLKSTLQREIDYYFNNTNVCLEYSFHDKL